MDAFVRFSFPKEAFSPEELRVLENLTQAAAIISSLYLIQKNSAFPGANFYPPDATKGEIEKAAQKNPALLSPYTFVERQGTVLVAVPYGVKFKKELMKAASFLRTAASFSSDPLFQKYLVARARDLLKDDYDRSNIIWLKTERSRIGCVIGPFDRYLDKLFFRKRAYMAWIGILDERKTEELDAFKRHILTTERTFLPGSKRVQISQVKVRIEDSCVFAGLVADFMFVGNNLPSSADIHLVKKYGTLFTLFKPTLEWRFQEWLLPIFKRVFAPDVQKRFPAADLQKAFLQMSVLHESCHSLMRYEDAASRLEELFPHFDELYTDLLGIKGCGTLILKNAFTERELETIMVMTICHSLYFYASLSMRPHLSPYAMGGALKLEFLLKGGALKKGARGFSFDPYRALMAFNQLTFIIEYYVALANHREAEEFLKKFSPERIFSVFKPLLKGIPGKKSLPLTKTRKTIR